MKTSSWSSRHSPTCAFLGGLVAARHRRRVRDQSAVLGDDDRLRDRRVLGQHCLDLTELDAVAADLHLVVGPAQEHQAPVRQPPHQVAGPVQPGTGRAERIRHEPLRGQRRTAEVTARQPGTAQVQLPHHAGRHRTQTRIQHVRPVPGSGMPIGTTDPPGCARTERRVHRRLGRAVGVEHPPARRPPRHQLRRHPLGAGQQHRVPRQVQVRRQLGQQRGRQDHEVHVVLVRVRRQLRTRHPPLGRHHHQPTAGQQTQTQVPERHVEARRRELQHPAVRADAEPLDLGRHQLRHTGVRHHDTLGPARWSRRCRSRTRRCPA